MTSLAIGVPKAAVAMKQPRLPPLELEVGVGLARIVTVATLFAFSTPLPPGLKIVTVKVLSAAAEGTFAIGTLIVLLAKSPSAQFSVPVVAVKLVPATAVPAFVWYCTDAAPVAPADRATVSTALPTVCATLSAARLNCSVPGVLSANIVMVVTVLVPSVAPPVGFLKLSVNASLASGVVSPTMGMVMVLAATSASAQLSVPDVAV